MSVSRGSRVQDADEEGALGRASSLLSEMIDTTGRPGADHLSSPATRSATLASRSI